MDSKEEKAAPIFWLAKLRKAYPLNYAPVNAKLCSHLTLRDGYQLGIGGTLSGGNLNQSLLLLNYDVNVHPNMCCSCRGH